MKSWKETSVERKDARHTMSSDATKYPPKKDTHRWCRGKEGVEHATVCHIYSDAKSTPENDARYDLYRKWRVLMCTVCGRELKFYMGGKNKPTWVDR